MACSSRPPRVAPDVEDELLHALSLELSDRFAQFFVGVDRELIELDIADTGRIRYEAVMLLIGMASRRTVTGIGPSIPERWIPSRTSLPRGPLSLFTTSFWSIPTPAIVLSSTVTIRSPPCMPALALGPPAMTFSTTTVSVAMLNHDADAVELSFDRLVGLSEVLRAEIHRVRVRDFRESAG